MEQGKHVVELGCGCGLVGLCFAARGAHVLLTDLPEPLVRALPSYAHDPYALARELCVLYWPRPTITMP